MKECPFCQRPAFLWGGDTCDMCDKDGDGVNDRDEPVGMGPAPETRSLFSAEEKGWEIVGGFELRRIRVTPPVPTMRVPLRKILTTEQMIMWNAVHHRLGQTI